MEVYLFIIIPFTFFRKIVGTQADILSTSVIHACTCAYAVLSLDVIQGPQRPKQGRSVRRGHRFTPVFLFLRRALVGTPPAVVIPARTRRSLALLVACLPRCLPGTSPPPTGHYPPGPTVHFQTSTVTAVPHAPCFCVGLPCRVGVRNEPCSTLNPRPGHRG